MILSAVATALLAVPTPAPAVLPASPPPSAARVAAVVPASTATRPGYRSCRYESYTSGARQHDGWWTPRATSTIAVGSPCRDINIKRTWSDAGPECARFRIVIPGMDGATNPRWVCKGDGWVVLMWHGVPSGLPDRLPYQVESYAPWSGVTATVKT